MSYQTQPGTFPHRVVAFLRAKPAGFEISTADLAEAMDFDRNAVRPCLIAARKHGVVAARNVTNRMGGVMLLWRLGNGRPQREELDEPVGSVEVLPVRRTITSAVPQLFRALEFEGKLLVTGMRIIDGVAVFEPEQVLQLKRTTDWWRAGA